jgi:archaellum biogenesis ATPase FlaH
MILHEITNHAKEHKRSVACLDGLEYLLVHNPLDEVVAFVSELTDMAQVDDFIMMIHVDPYALDDATLAKLSRNMVPVTDRTPSNGM